MKLNLGSGRYRLLGFLNIDADEGVRMQEFLPLLRDGSVEAITVSHALMYLTSKDLKAVFAEVCRVLAPGGVIRVTEDDTRYPENAWPGHVTLLTESRVSELISNAGMVAAKVEPGQSIYTDESLIQAWHGDPPKVFHIEGFKP